MSKEVSIEPLKGVAEEYNGTAFHRSDTEPSEDVMIILPATEIVETYKMQFDCGVLITSLTLTEDGSLLMSGKRFVDDAVEEE